MQMKDSELKGIKSIEVGFSILKIVSNAEQPLTITEISKACNMPKSQIYRYLISLCRISFLEKSDDLRYSLGSELTLLGLRSMKKIDIREKALPYIKRLNEFVDETVALSIWGEKEGPFFISWEESRKPININVRAGSTVPLTITATGKVFAAFYSREKTQNFIDEELKEFSIDLNKFNQMIKDVKDNGYATTNQYLQGISAIAAPVFNQNKDLVTVITIIGLSGTLDISSDSQITQELLKTSKELSNELGYTDM